MLPSFENPNLPSFVLNTTYFIPPKTKGINFPHVVRLRDISMLHNTLVSSTLLGDLCLPAEQIIQSGHLPAL